MPRTPLSVSGRGHRWDVTDGAALMIIRGAVAADAGGIASVHLRAWEAAYRTLVPDSYLERLSVEDRTRHWRQTIGRGDPEVWVASEDSEITGWVAFGASRDEGALPGVGEI